MLYRLARPLLFTLSAEQAHDLTLDMLRRGAGKLLPGTVPDRPVSVMGLDLPNPVGLAAGLDKNGETLGEYSNACSGCAKEGVAYTVPVK